MPLLCHEHVLLLMLSSTEVEMFGGLTFDLTSRMIGFEYFGRRIHEFDAGEHCRICVVPHSAAACLTHETSDLCV